MNGTGPRQGTLLGNVKVTDPVNDELLRFRSSDATWVNSPAASTTVATDDITIQGDGGALNKIRLKRAFPDDDSLEGDGTQAVPLKIRKVYVDPVTLTGLGTSASPLAGVSLAQYNSYYTQLQAIPDTTTTVVKADALSGGTTGQPVLTSSILNLATGEFTLPLTGAWSCSIMAPWPLNASGYRIVALDVETTTPGVYIPSFQLQAIGSSLIPIYQTLGCCFVNFLVGQKIRFRVTQTTGSATGNMSFKVCVVYVHP